MRLHRCQSGAALAFRGGLFVLFCFQFLFLALFFVFFLLLKVLVQIWCLPLEAIYQLNALVTRALSLRLVLHVFLQITIYVVTKSFAQTFQI